MGFQAIGLHHVLDGAALLGDLQFAVAIGTLESDVQVGQQLLLLVVLEAQFLRQDQRAARHHCLTTAAEQGRALFGGDELQGEVQRHQRAGLELQGQDVGF